MKIVFWILVITLILWAGYSLMKAPKEEKENTNFIRDDITTEVEKIRAQFPDTTGMSGKG